jgi:hypothetical protein
MTSPNTCMLCPDYAQGSVRGGGFRTLELVCGQLVSKASTAVESLDARYHSTFYSVLHRAASPQGVGDSGSPVEGKGVSWVRRLRIGNVCMV